MPNLIISDISKAIEKNPCKKIYFCNAMSQPGETDGYTVQDHIHAIEKHSFKHPVDLVVVNQSMLPKEVLDMYACPLHLKLKKKFVKKKSMLK